MKRFPGGVRGTAALLALLACAGVPLSWHFAPHDGWSWLAAEGHVVDEGRDTATRFGYADLWQVSLYVDDPFASATRKNLLRWEEVVATWPEVSRVVGPADVLRLEPRQAEHLPDRPSPPPPSYADVPASGGDAATVDAAVRARMRGRGDVRGWFFDRDERIVRLFVVAEGGEPSVERLASSARVVGLVGASANAKLKVESVWPRPAVSTLAGTWRVALGVAAVLSLLGFAAAFFSALGRRRRSTRRMIMAAMATAAGFALPFAVAPSPAWRNAGMALAVSAAVPLLLTLAIRGARAGGRHARLTVWWRGLGVLSGLLIVGCVLANALGVGNAPTALHRGGHWLEAHESAAQAIGIVAVEADLEEPVVLAEMLRLTDFLRALSAVAEAWSPADAFVGAGEGFAGHATLPVDRSGVRRLWARARNDGAVLLGLSAARDAALVTYRYRPTSTLRERREATRTVSAYLAQDLRSALLPINVEDASLPPATRSLGRGVLAGDLKERLTHLAVASGVVLSREQELGLGRVARQAALVPTADPEKLTTVVARILDDAQRAGRGAHLLARSSERARLAHNVANQPWESGLPELRASLRDEARFDAEVEPLAVWLFPKILAARFDAAAALNLEALKEATGLPSRRQASLAASPSARLPGAEDQAPEIEAALVQGMGPVVGVPVGPGTRGAVRLRAWAADAAEGDRELAASWGFRIVAGLAAVAVVHGLLWFLVLGIDGLAFAAISFAPAALLMAVRLTSPADVGLPFLLVLGGALAMGWGLVVAWAPPLPSRARGPVHGL